MGEEMRRASERGDEMRTSERGDEENQWERR